RPSLVGRSPSPRRAERGSSWSADEPLANERAPLDRASTYSNPMPMKYRLLGPTGLRVSEVCLGAMTFGDEASEGWGASRAEARRIFDVFCQAGGNFVDTAVNYGGGMSERYLGELVASERDRYVVATKYSAFLRAGD